MKDLRPDGRKRVVAMPISKGIAIAVFLAVTAFTSVAPSAAGAVSPTEETPAQPLRLEAETSSVSLGWQPIRSVALSTMPESIQVGVDCGMEDMCGLDPCLCGSAVDQWGACACNGLKTVRPDLAFTSSDGGVVRVLEIGGRDLLIPMGTGTATVSVRGSLPHHSDAVTSFEVTVKSPALVVMGVVGVICLAVLAGIVLGVRQIWRSLRRRAGDERSSIVSEEGLDS